MSFRTTDVFLRTFGIASLAELRRCTVTTMRKWKRPRGRLRIPAMRTRTAHSVCTGRGCVMHTFLMVLLWVVLGLLALLAVLLIVPAAVAVEYKQGEFTARLKLLGIFSFRLYPMKEKADRKKKKTPPRPESAPKEQPAKPEPKLHMTFEKVQGILSAAGAFMRRVFRALHFTGIVFILPIHRTMRRRRLSPMAERRHGWAELRRAAKFSQPELQAGAYFG